MWCQSWQSTFRVSIDAASIIFLVQLFEAQHREKADKLTQTSRYKISALNLWAIPLRWKKQVGLP